MERNDDMKEKYLKWAVDKLNECGNRAVINPVANWKSVQLYESLHDYIEKFYPNRVIWNGEANEWQIIIPEKES